MIAVSGVRYHTVNKTNIDHNETLTLFQILVRTPCGNDRYDPVHKLHIGKSVCMQVLLYSAVPYFHYNYSFSRFALLEIIYLDYFG